MEPNNCTIVEHAFAVREEALRYWGEHDCVTTYVGQVTPLRLENGDRRWLVFERIPVEGK